MRTYTVDEKRTAIAATFKLGAAAASLRTGISAGTLSCWAYKARHGVPGYTLSEGPAPSPAQPVAAEPAVAAEPPAAAEPVVAAEPPAAAAKPGPKTDTPSTTLSRSGVARSYTPSQRANALERAAQVGVTAAAEELGITRFAIYDWRRKVRLAAAGKGESPTTGPAAADIETQRDKEILDLWRQHPGLGPSQIRNQLRRAGIKVAVHTVRRVMEDAGYRPPKVQRDPHVQRYEAVRPNQMWHLDFVHRHINRTNTFTLILIDDHARFVVGHGVDDAERADMVIQTFMDAVQRHGRPELVMHDKGSAFWSWKGISRFTALLTELGVDQIVAEHKEWNGKVEVFNANIAKELFDVQRFYDVAEMKRRLASHLHWYNHRRTHHALGGLLVPADRYYGRVEEVMARIEAGAGASAHTDLLDLRDRVLELFKVVSRDGKPEIWLLGQPLLSAIAK